MSGNYKLKFLRSSLGASFTKDLAPAQTGQCAIVATITDGSSIEDTIVGIYSSAGNTQCCGAAGIYMSPSYLESNLYKEGILVELFEMCKKSTFFISYRGWGGLSERLKSAADLFNKKYKDVFTLSVKEFPDTERTGLIVFVSVVAVSKDWNEVGEKVRTLVHKIKGEE